MTNRIESVELERSPVVQLPLRQSRPWPFEVEDMHIGGLSGEELRYLSPNVPELLELSPEDREQRIIDMCGFLSSPVYARGSAESYVARTIVMHSLLESGFRAGSPEAKQGIVRTIDQLVSGQDSEFRREEAPDVLVVIAEGVGEILWEDKVCLSSGMTETCGGTVVFPLLSKHRRDFEICLKTLAGLERERRQQVPYVPKVVARQILGSYKSKRPRYPFQSASRFYDLPEPLVRRTLPLAHSLPQPDFWKRAKSALAID